MTPCTTNALLKLRTAVARHRMVADTTRELEQSSDRALAEMGIARGDVASIAYRSSRTIVKGQPR